MIADDLIAATKNGAIVGIDQRRAMTGDLAREGARVTHSSRSTATACASALLRRADKLGA